MQLQDMFKLVPEDKPEIIDSVVTQSHANYWRVIVQPKTDSINLC